MSIVRILLGIGGFGATAAGIWFGLDRKKQDDLYQAKMTKFRETAKKVNGYLAANSWREKLYDPEHWIWNKKLDAYESQNWSGKLSHIPPEIRNNPEAFKDFCFGKLEENADDLNKSDGVALTGSLSPEKMFWDYCLVAELEFKQLSEKR
ncbi:hypothetical protein MHF_1295 [Mycoplasma haemofelis Ohio2]|uniref:Uncharacterized protein n=1 Tax=Mycoplasma haemofelis (strain Ohio2) TaxID=859194 RepID=F6FG33_MYCHI|nr:hypothetical protein MHF_1295 [Mycoplasma haemofelis Ohio2]